MRPLRLWLCLFVGTISTALTLVDNAHAATIAGVKSPYRYAAVTQVSLFGPIEAGDTEKLLATLKELPDVTHLTLNSPGGSIVEAVKMAEIVRKLALNSEVARNGYCASACFFLFIAGTGRTASPAELMSVSEQNKYQQLQKQVTGHVRAMPGFVGLHRPYISKVAGVDPNQAAIMRRVKDYLDLNLLPRRLIDLMMSRASNEIYWLTDDDLMEIGEYSPSQEEYFIQQCSYVKNYVFKAVALSNRGQRERALAAGDRANECLSPLIDAIREEGRKALNQGWQPKSPL